MKKILTVHFIIAVIAASAVYAQDRGAKYPNLAAAQSMIEKAHLKITDAQKAQDGLGGHAAKAKDFLEEAGKEIKLSVEAAEDNRDKSQGDAKSAKSANPLAENISAKKHPHLAEAQQLVHDAYARISAAQKANEFDLGGHAAKAKRLLEQASQELKLAAVAANQ